MMVIVEKAKPNRRGERGWKIRWKVDGREGSKTLRGVTKSQAESYAAKLRLELLEMPGVEKPPVSLRHCVERWRQQKWDGWEPATRESVTYAIQRIPAWLMRKDASKITTADVKAALAEVASKVGMDAVKKTKQAIAGGLTWAVDDNRIKSNPAAGKVVPNRAKGTSKAARKTAAARERGQTVDLDEALTRREVLSIISHTSPHWQPLGIVLLETGIRIGEAAALQVRHVNLDERTLVVEVSKDTAATRFTDDGAYGQDKATKAWRSDRTIKLSWLAVAVLRCLVEGKGPEEYVFVGPRGGRLEPDRYREREWRPAAKAAGFDGYTPHDIRHHVASVLLSNGVTPRTVAKHMGHSLQVLMSTYAKYFEQDDTRLRDALDRAASS